MTSIPTPRVAAGVDAIPFRMALAGGWIDQPFVSRLNPSPPGSMVVARLEPTVPLMERAGMATGTRRVASRLWNGQLPDRDPAELVRELYAAENAEQADPSGSQDMIGLIYPGISRLDYDYRHEGGIFPSHIESTSDPEIVGWLEQVIHVVPVAPRPDGYNPLGAKILDACWIKRLGQTGKDCYDAILRRDLSGLGASMNECMRCWEAILPHTVRHPTLTVDLVARLESYRARYPGAMYSGCGGGYVYVASEDAVPDSFRVTIGTGRPNRIVRVGG
jgi:hypothetical protein